jgi:hypothetical protein
MPINGHVYQVTDAAECFGGMLLGGPDTPPTAGFEPWAGIQVQLNLWANVRGFLGLILEFMDLEGEASRVTTTAADGSFSFPDLSGGQLDAIAAWAGKPGGEALSVQVWVIQGTFPFQVMYRSGLSITLDEAEGKELNIWLLPYSLPEKDGISAGTISGVMAGSSLPENTSITASPSGLWFSGSAGGIDGQFGIGVTPDWSSDLDSYFDLTLLSWNIDVGWPADWCTSAHHVLGEIRAGVQNAASGVNTAVSNKIISILEQNYPSISEEDIGNFVSNDVSITFTNLAYPGIPYTWLASNKSDGTIVLTAQPVIAWPTSFSADPRKRRVPHKGIPRYPYPLIHPVFGLYNRPDSSVSG